MTFAHVGYHRANMGVQDMTQESSEIELSSILHITYLNLDIYWERALR